MSLAATVAKVAGAISGIVGVPAAAVGIHKHATSLYEVENKVISGEVGLEVKDGTENTKKTIQVKTVENAGSATTTKWSKTETDGYWWECVITVPPSIDLNNGTELQGKLFKDTTSGDTDKNRKLENNKKLVKECSKSRDDGASSKKVMATLDFSKSEKVTKLQDLFDVIFGKEQVTE